MERREVPQGEGGIGLSGGTGLTGLGGNVVALAVAGLAEGVADLTGRVSGALAGGAGA